MMQWMIAHSSELFAGALIGGPIVLGAAIIAVTRKQPDDYVPPVPGETFRHMRQSMGHSEPFGKRRQPQS